ncbi:hypothetical protein AA14337_3031 [Acetobacter malorum DSM 14337]|uniref:Uncharacterized protein n=1 Tax=Acetobacter malorum DSM 14337 TaxID=1307910 RepID=A0ABQ0PZ94_9PROT|nr:hypothetical protein [Acetobacter malorum]KXV05624.1 hypothetical protein AD930_10810 [Acetobacter malorum]GBQ85280.1 hypothetical protein AA14337_3031 [Acetobacter malorum DSM 14337]
MPEQPSLPFHGGDAPEGVSAGNAHASARKSKPKAQGGATDLQSKVLSALTKCMVHSAGEPVSAMAVKLHLDGTKPVGVVSTCLSALERKNMVNSTSYYGGDFCMHRLYFLPGTERLPDGAVA